MSNLDNMQKEKGSRSKIVKNRIPYGAKPGILVSVDVVPVPDPTRETSPRVRVGSGIPAGTGRPAHL